MNFMSSMPRTRWRLWLVCLAALLIASGGYELYPDHRLWQAWLFLPVMIFMDSTSWDPEASEHICLMLALLGLFVGVSWVIHILVLAACRAVGRRRKAGH
jgi:hypothetical protein